jgi:hypothetical protein
MAYAATSRFEELENANVSIQKENKELRAILAAHAGQIRRNKQTIYLYAGGFYNRKERQIFEDHLNILEGQSFDENYKTYIEEEMELIWPTTRQGNIHEERLTALEDKFQAREEALAEQLAVLEENLTQIFRDRDEQLTEFETKLKEMEIKINAMEQRQLEKLGLDM